MVPPCRKTIEISQLQYTVIDVPVVQVEQVHFPVWQTIEIRSFSTRRMVDVLVVRVEQVS